MTLPVANQNISEPVVQKLSDREYIEKYYSDLPVMKFIAECESNSRQFDSNGQVVKNPKSSAIGAMQIMASIHQKDAESLGFDIYSLEGNVAFARHLYEKQGTKPWEADLASKHCWLPKFTSK